MPADQLTLDRIQLMHPTLRGALLLDYQAANNLLPKGVRLRFVQTLRTFEEQHKLFKQRPKVTNADAGKSYHNYGLAFDFAILFDKNGDSKFETTSWSVDKYWMTVVNYFKSKGWTSGLDFPGDFQDAPHLEQKLGYNWRDLLKLYKAGKFISGTKYLEIDKMAKFASKRPLKLIEDFVYKEI